MSGGTKGTSVEARRSLQCLVLWKGHQTTCPWVSVQALSALLLVPLQTGVAVSLSTICCCSLVKSRSVSEGGLQLVQLTSIRAAADFGDSVGPELVDIISGLSYCLSLVFQCAQEFQDNLVCGLGKTSVLDPLQLPAQPVLSGSQLDNAVLIQRPCPACSYTPALSLLRLLWIVLFPCCCKASLRPKEVGYLFCFMSPLSCGVAVARSASSRFLYRFLLCRVSVACLHYSTA